MAGIQQKFTYSTSPQNVTTLPTPPTGYAYHTSDSHFTVNNSTYELRMIGGTPAGTYSFRAVAVPQSGGSAAITRDFVILVEKANPSVNITLYNVTYNGSAQSIAVGTVTEGVQSSLRIGIGTDSSAPSSWSESPVKRTSAGTYYIWYKVSESTNYNAISQRSKGTARIYKATPTISVTGANLEYSGSAQTLVSSVSTSGDGTIYYGLGSSSTSAPSSWSTTKPTATNVGTYYIWIKADAGNNYNAVDAVYKTTASIRQPTSSVTLNMNGGSDGTKTVTATYGSAMPAITKPTLSGWTFQGYYDTSASTGGTQYYTAAGASARTWNKTGSQTLYARWSRSITFKHGKSNASSNAVTQYKGGNVTPPSITAISGWTALGWRDDTTAGAKEYGANNTTAFAYTGTATTLYAVYSRTLTLSYTNGGGSGTAPTATTATQYYNANGATSSASFTLRANTFTAPTDVGGGWAFSKWGAGNANAAWSWQPGVDAGASTSTAAVWTRTVTFKSGVSSATSKQATQTRGSGVSVPSGTVTPSGWTFLGWRTDTTASTASYTGSTFSPSATTLYAVFSRTLTLSYTNGGGTGTAPSNTTATQYYNSYGNKSTASFTLRANTFTRAGYYFSKWAAGNANATWSWSPAVDAAVSTSTAAQWVAYKITLTYNVNGGTIADSPHKYNNTTYFKVSDNLVVSSTTSSGTYANVTATINTATAYANLWNVGSFNVTKTGYHIDGADAYICGSVLVNQDDSETNTTNKVTVARLNGGTALTADISKTLSINWKANTYTVTLNKNNGSGGTDSVTATYNSAMPAATMPTRTGYTFNGYYDATSGGTQYYTAAGASTRAWNKTSNTTLYAQWTEKTATLTYNNSGLSNSTVPSAVTMKYTTATTLTAGTAPSGYSFYGWATSDANAKAGTRAYTGTQQYKAANVVPSAATLYAIWYGTVTYNANGHGTAPSATTMYYTPQPKAAAAISATGYTFGGWNTKADGSGTSYTAGSSVLKNANEYKANYTLYAKWTANTYTITFNKNGGTGGTATATATYDSAMPAITKPTRAGYKFEGYYDAESGGTQYYTAAGASARSWNKTSNTTLYAHWSATGSFVSGDYRFTVLSTGKVRAEAADKTKTTYAAIPTTVADPENSGGILKVTSIEGCFNGCNNLEGDIFVSHSSGELESYGNVFSTTKPVYILATSSPVDHSVWQSVANQKSNVTYLSADSDYSYIVNTSNHTYSIKALNITKTSYSNPKSTLSSAATWTADSMAGCFQGCNKLTASPTIPNTITNMSNCFSNCAALVNAPTIPNTVTNMNSCFNGCTSLQHITNIPANVATMTNCFNNCTNLRGNIVVNNKNVTSSGIFTNAGSTQNQIYIINGLGSDSTLASTWRTIANTNSNVHYEIDDLDLPATFTVKRQIYTDNTTESINGYPGAYINSSFSLPLANIKYMPVGWTISWNSTKPAEKMGTTSISNTITTQADSSKLYFNNITRFLTNNNSNINVTNYYTITAGNKTLTTNRVYNATLSNASANRNVIDAFYKDSDYIYTIIDNSSSPKKVAAYAFNRSKTGYSNIPSTITVSGTNYTVTSLYYPSYNTSGALDTNNYAGGCFEGCSAMTSAPNNGIPSTITDVRNCFKNCSSLHGNIIVNGNPSNYSGLFTGAGTAVAQDIYIINSGKQEIPAFWRSIANSYTKVHFEGDDNPEPLISSIYINRGFYVSEYNTWEEDDTGNWIKLNIYYTLQTSKLPVGWTNQLVKEYYLIFDDEIWDSRPIYMAEETQIAYVQPQSKTLKNTTDYYTKSGNTYTLVTNPTQAGLNNNLYWIKGYKNNIVFYFQAANRSGEEVNYQTNVKLTLTDYLDHEGEKTEIVYAMFAMLDFLPGGHGMAIGQASFREGLEINLPTLIGEELIPPYRTNAFIPTQDHLVVGDKTYYNSAGTAISNPQPDSVEEYYEKVSVVDLNQRQLILGKYNVPDHAEATNQNYKFAYLIVGNGTDDAHRSNLLRVNEDGVTINGLQVNTINGVTVGSSPKFTDNNTWIKVSTTADGYISKLSGSSTQWFNGNGTWSTPTAANVGALSSNGTAVAASTLAHKTLNNTTINNTAGTFAFSGSGDPWAGTDWVGFQVGDSADKFQFTRTGTAPMFRYNDSGGTNSSDWSNWVTLYSTGNKPTVSDVITGNASTVNTVDPITGAYIGMHASNKAFGLPAAAIKIEYSTNSGSSWTDYGATDAQKRNLFDESRAQTFYLGKKNTAGAQTTNDWLRITIEPTDRYVRIFGIYVWMTTGGNTVTVDLERSTIGAKDTFTTVFTGQPLQGWSGANIRYFSAGTFGGGSTQTGNNYKYRMTFKNTAINSNASYRQAGILDIRFLGDAVWTSPNNMVMRNHAYSYDADLNVTFPAQVTATQFNGRATKLKDYTNNNDTWLDYGAAALTSCTYLGAWNGYRMGAIKPENITAGIATRLAAFSSASTTMTWGNQTGTVLGCYATTGGGGLGFRDNNPASGQVSMTIDGTVYIKEGAVNVGDAIKSITRSGTTFTYTTLWGNTGTFTQQDSNTWRGIQDNLTSSTNTTESLSAKQGYLLANGSARDSTKLPLAGGTMTGSIIQKNTSWTRGTTPSATSYRTYEFKDTNNKRVSQVEAGLTGAGKSLLNLFVLNHVSDTDTYSGIQIFKDVGVTTSATATFNANTGLFTATSFSGNGASLTSLNASNLESGTVPIARIPTGTGSTQVALGNHTHTLSIAADSGTNALTLAASTKYKLTAGGSTYIFTTPPNTITTATTTGTGNAVTAISASNGALTVTKGSTFLTSHQTVTNKGATLAWGSATTVATIGSTNINVSLPSDSKILKFDSGGSLTSAGTLVIDSAFTYSAAITAASGATAPGTITVNKSGYWPLLIAQITKRNGSGGSGHTNWCGNTWELAASSGKAVVTFGGNAAGGAVTKIEVGVKILWVKI